MNFKKVIYLANAYSSREKDRDKAKLQEATRRSLEAYIGGKLRKKYKVAVIPPIASSAAMADICEFDTGFGEWESDDLTFIGRCSDEVWVVVSDGWKESKGVQAEIAYAHSKGIPVRYINIETLEITDFVPDYESQD